MTDTNLIIIITAFLGALAAIYILYSIILFQGISSKNGEELQLSTKNILEQVEILFQKKEYALVQLLATKYLDRIPRHIEVRIFLAKAYFEDRRYNQAIKQCAIILKKQPNNIDIRQLLGDCYIKKQLINRAIREYEYIFDYRKNNKKVVRTLAELYEQSDQLYSAIGVYDVLAELMELDDDIAEVHSILARLNEEVKDYPAAFESYKTRLGIYPHDVDTNKKLTELYIKIKNYPIAIETLLFMLSFINEGKILNWIYENLVDLYVETEDFEKAIECSEKLLDLQGSDKFKVKNNIATFHIKLNRFAEGITILEDLAMLSQNDFDITLKLADAYIQNKNYDKALERYKLLLDKATPKEAKVVNLLTSELFVNWAIEMTGQEKYTESFEYLENAIEYNMLNSEIYYNIAYNHYLLKSYANTVEALNKALEYDKDKELHTKYLLLLSEAQHALNNSFEEKKALTDLLKLDEKHPLGLYRVGLMYAAQHDIKKAEDSFKKAVLYDPELIPAKYNLALLYENNNIEKAKELYKEILEQDPTFEDARKSFAELTSSGGF